MNIKTIIKKLRRNKMSETFESRIVYRNKSKDGKQLTYALSTPRDIAEKWINKELLVTIEEL